MPDDSGGQITRKLPTFDRWLRFDARTDLRYEAENGPARIAQLRQTIYFGAVIFNVYIVSNLLLVPEFAFESLGFRMLVITPASLMIAYFIGHMGHRMREWLVTTGMIGVHIFPVIMFWVSQSPLGAYTFGELSLTVIYANMLLALRFGHAVFFTIVALGIVCVAAATKPGLEPALRFAFMFQFAVACLFSIYANYLLERRRCLDYTTALRAIFRAEAAESSSLAFQEISKKDALTGLPNRRYLDEALEDWCMDSSPAAVFMIDIDHFKMFNDTLGHPAGDDCLLQVAAAFRRLSDEPDAFCARFGGEEFTLALPGAGAADALRKADQIVATIANLGITHPGRTDGIGAITVSVGVALKPAGELVSPKEILSQADQALYRAKRYGRNRFEIAEDSNARTA